MGKIILIVDITVRLRPCQTIFCTLNYVEIGNGDHKPCFLEEEFLRPELDGVAGHKSADPRRQVEFSGASILGGGKMGLSGEWVIYNLLVARDLASLVTHEGSIFLRALVPRVAGGRQGGGSGNGGEQADGLAGSPSPAMGELRP